jgi:hypothetical protein
MTTKKTPLSSEEKNKKVRTPSRPWQGTLLAILNIVSLIIIAIIIIIIPFAILLTVAGGALGFAKDVNPSISPSIRLIYGGVLTLGLILYFILGIFITRGLFKGKKWAVIIMLIFSGFSLMGTLFDFSLFSFIILALFLYLEIACLIHPFYGGKK